MNNLQTYEQHYKGKWDGDYPAKYFIEYSTFISVYLEHPIQINRRNYDKVLEDLRYVKDKLEYEWEKYRDDFVDISNVTVMVDTDDRDIVSLQVKMDADKQENNYHTLLKHEFKELT